MSVLRMLAIRKSFGNTQALKAVDLEVHRGTVHALVGENGAGKSTLMKILSGALAPDSGHIELVGRPYKPRNPAEAKKAGVAMVYQELALTPHMTVAQNLTLGLEVHRFGILKKMDKEIGDVLAALEGVHLDPEARIADLGIGSRQMVEIGRALLQKASVLVLDEPTAGLSQPEVKLLFTLIRQLRSRDVSIIYISHFLEEVLEISDHYTVLRDGESVATGPTKEATSAGLITHMIGREARDLYPPVSASMGPPQFVFSLEAAPGIPEPVLLEIRAGEILGIAGLMGSGRTELLRSLCGLNGPVKGTLRSSGREHSLASIRPDKAFAIGYGLLSEDRKAEGLALNLSIEDNLTFPDLGKYLRLFILNLAQRRRDARSWALKMVLRCSSTRARVDSLSGGNQQKVAIGRLLQQNLRLLLLDEPTRGVDVGAKAQIYSLIANAAEKGMAVVVVSSYLPELFGICTSMAVMHKGRLSGKKNVDEWTPHSVMSFAATGSIGKD